MLQDPGSNSEMLSINLRSVVLISALVELTLLFKYFVIYWAFCLVSQEGILVNLRSVVLISALVELTLLFKYFVIYWAFCLVSQEGILV